MGHRREYEYRVDEKRRRGGDVSAYHHGVFEPIIQFAKRLK